MKNLTSNLLANALESYVRDKALTARATSSADSADQNNLIYSSYLALLDKVWVHPH